MKRLIVFMTLFLSVNSFAAPSPTGPCLEQFGNQFKFAVNKTLSEQYNVQYKEEFIKILSKQGILITADEIDFNVGASASYTYKYKNYYANQFYFEVPEKVTIAGKTFVIETGYEDQWIFASGSGNMAPKKGSNECSFNVALFDGMYSTIRDEAGKTLGYVEGSVIASFKQDLP